MHRNFCLRTLDDKMRITSLLLNAVHNGNLEDFIAFADIFLDGINTLQEELRTTSKAEHLSIICMYVYMNTQH